ncbi:MAG: hypothetical protein L3J09_10185 [Flavobacteriaceae bacterium]|nr:hypothetical protein [Flavobacteriaceae bacterium]
MIKRNINTYKEEIKKKHKEEGHIFLPETTPLSIKKRCLTLLQEKVGTQDEDIIKSFFKFHKNSNNLYELVGKVDIDKLKPIQNFLTSSSSTFRYEEAYSFTAFIIDYNPRPYSEYLKGNATEKSKTKLIGKEVVDKTGVSKNKKPHSLNPLIYVGLITAVLISIWIVKDLIVEKKEKPIPQKIEVANYNYHGDLNYYYNLNKKGKVELYDKKGRIYNEPLKPATKEIMLTYFKQNNDTGKRRWFKEVVVNNKGKKNDNLKKENITLDKKKAEPKEQPKEKGSSTKEIATKTKIVITNNNVLDNSISAFFKKNYTKTKEKYTCKGIATYNYRESKTNKRLVVCDIELSYTIISNSTQKKLDDGLINATGSGFSKNKAKQQAISRLLLN